MSNHYHLLVETPEANLVAGMKAGRKALEAEWKRIRRGWYLGEDGFRGRMLKMVKATLGQGCAASYVGPAKRAHGEAEAERLLGEGTAALGLEVSELEDRPKGMAEKEVLAWWLRGRTTVGRRWLSERLRMGEESRVSRAVRRVQAGREGKQERIKRRLLAGAGNGPKKETRL